MKEKQAIITLKNSINMLVIGFFNSSDEINDLNSAISTLREMADNYEKNFATINIPNK